MTMENILIGVIALFLIFRLFLTIRQDKQAKKTIPTELEKIIAPKLEEVHFLSEVEMIFKMITTAFAEGKIAEVKSLLSKKAYQVFSAAIQERQEKKQELDFSLICLNSVKILEKAEDKCTVEFISEQINVLKDSTGAVLEGDPMVVAKMSDVWEFMTNENKHWVLTGVKSEAV